MTTHDPAKVDARRVALARYRPGHAWLGHASHDVHLIELPVRAESAGEFLALCGIPLSATQIETVNPGEGAPCTLCLLVHLFGSPPSDPAPPAEHNAPGRLAGPADYRAWGWPVTLHHNEIWLTLHDAVALIIPSDLAVDVTRLLTDRRCPPAVLAHPHLPHHQIVLGGEPYGVPLPLPPRLHRATGMLPLPPTRTPRGPLTWVHPPEPHALALCREIDIFAALHALGKVGGGS